MVGQSLGPDTITAKLDEGLSLLTRQGFGRFTPAHG